jgi:lipopolysaccharide biosynthesis glycosyltransferase
MHGCYKHRRGVCVMSVDVAVCGDRHVLPGMAVTVRSALESSSQPLNIHVIGTGLTEADRAKLDRSWGHPNRASVHFAEIARQELRDFRSTAYLKSKAAYARYFIGELFPNLTRCIYLDADLLVFRDLAEAFHMDLGGKLAGAVRDVGVRLKPAGARLHERLALRDEANYFNSGFLVLDLAAWRREKIVEELVRISIERFDTLDSQDQDALNIVLEDRVLLLDVVWNTSQYEKPAPLAGHVVHLIGTVKPWHASYRDNFREAYYEQVIFRAFSDVLARTEFRDWRPWDFAGIGKYAEFVLRAIPTRDMIAGKLRRTIAGLALRQQRAALRTQAPADVRRRAPES